MFEIWICFRYIDFSGIRFTHFPLNDRLSIAGHVHPGVKLKKGRIVNYFKAFAVDDFGVICPAYGHYTGQYSKRDHLKTYYFIDRGRVKPYLA